MGYNGGNIDLIVDFLGDFRVIVGPTPAQMDDFCDLHGTLDTPVSRIVTVNRDGYSPFIFIPRVFKGSWGPRGNFEKYIWVLISINLGT